MAKVKKAATKPPKKSGGKPAKKSAAKTKKPAAKKSAARKAPPKAPAKKPAPKPANIAAKAKPTKPSGMPERVRDAILNILDDRQADQVTSIDLRGKSSMADYMIIASARAARQIAAIADLVRSELGKLGIRQVRAEGVTQGDWALVDAGDVILHIFRPEVRKFYNIERIYGANTPA